MVLFALEKIYLLCNKQVVYMCKAKACTASGAHSNDEDAPVAPVAPGDTYKGYTILPEQQHSMQKYSCKYLYLGWSILGN